MANIAWHSNNYSVFDPGVSPADFWAIFSSHPIHHKITGKFDLGLYSTLAYLRRPYELHKQQTRIESFQDTAYKYLRPTVISVQTKKISKGIHSEDDSQLDTHLQYLVSTGKRKVSTMSTLSIFRRDVRKCSKMPGPRCHFHQTKSTQYIPSSSTQSANTNLPASKATYEYKLSLLLNIPCNSTSNISTPIPNNVRMTLMNAIRHQNIIEWDNFLKGYTSIYWLEIFNESHSGDNVAHLTLDWDHRLVEECIQLSKAI